MITRYFSAVTVSFSPFYRSSRTARLFMALLPSTARQQGVKVTTKVLPLPPAPLGNGKSSAGAGVGTAAEKQQKGKEKELGPESWVEVTFS